MAAEKLRIPRAEKNPNLSHLPHKAVEKQWMEGSQSACVKSLQVLWPTAGADRGTGGRHFSCRVPLDLLLSLPTCQVR